MSVEGGRLWMGRRRWINGVRFRVEPNGLVVVARSGEHFFAWEDGFPKAPRAGARAWWTYGFAGSRYNFPGVVAVVGTMQHRIVDPPWDLPDRKDWTVSPGWGFRGMFNGFAYVEFPALTNYLAATPAARPALTNVARLCALLAAFRAHGWRHRRPTGEPLMGDALDMHLAVTRALHVMWPRRYRGRPVRGEPRPGLDDVLAAVRVELPRFVSSRTSDSDIRERLDREFAVGAWPFDALLEPVTRP